MQRWLEHQIIKSIAPNTQPKPEKEGEGREGSKSKQFTFSLGSPHNPLPPKL